MDASGEGPASILLPSKRRMRRPVLKSKGRDAEEEEEEKTVSLKTKSCDLCDYSTKYGSHLKMHRSVVHEGVKPFGCDLCKYRCYERNRMGRHRDSVHGDAYNFPCDRCDLRFKIKERLNAHVRSHHERHRLVKCDRCDHVALTRGHVKIHSMAVHDKLRSHACDVVGCDFTTNIKVHLSRHFLAKHLYNNNNSENNDKMRHECDKCEYSANTERGLRDHVDFKHEKNFRYVCHVCQLPLQTFRCLSRHMKMIHSDKKEDKSKRFKCEQCPFSTNGRETLQNHAKLAHLTNLECILCPFKTGSEAVMRRHERSHEKEGRAEKPKRSFRCETTGCDYTSSFRQNFKRHVQMQHLGIDLNKYKCDRCDKFSAATRKKLQEHVDFIHDKNFRYVCDVCDVPRRNLSDLNAHRKNVHGGGIEGGGSSVERRRRAKFKMFKCDRCEFVSSSAKLFARHVKVVHRRNVVEEVLLSCLLCPFTTRYEGNLKRHSANVHGRRQRRQDETAVSERSVNNLKKVKQEVMETIVEEEEVTFTIKVKEEKIGEG